MFPADDLPTARVNLDTFPHSEHQIATTIPASMQDPVFDSQMESQAKIFGDGSRLLSQDESHQSKSSSFDSPMRQHSRQYTPKIPVKETLNAHSEYRNSQDDGTAEHHINQYGIKEEIGRGSFGAVHLAIDQHQHEYAVKEFSKARLRKRAHSHILRHPRRAQRSGENPQISFNSPLHRHPSDGATEEVNDPLYLIRREIAIMKKLHHNNLVRLFEVLDDPTEDSLYMVMEMCKKGVIMKVGLGESADPYSDEQCRTWFRDLILGIEYLHAQGVVHRDIKPDNCLLTSDDVLKVVDFGVSEMFEKHSEMYTAKSAGSPAFLPPELCVAKHGDVSGKAADIWSMGVTLYCLRYGHIPFEKESVLELYDSIRTDEVKYDEEHDEAFLDLMRRILEKDPDKRITMPEIRNHPWITKNGTDPLLTEEENTADLVAVTDEEVKTAITRTLRSVVTLVKAVQKFRRLIAHPEGHHMSILGDSHFVEPPMMMDENEELDLQSIMRSTRPEQQNSPRQQNSPLVHSTFASYDENSAITDHNPSSYDQQSLTKPEKLGEGEEPKNIVEHQSTLEGSRGHAHDPLEDHLYLFIGPSQLTDTPKNDSNSQSTGETQEGIVESPGVVEDNIDFDPVTMPVVSESPGAAEFDIYETAYRKEIDRIRQQFLKPAPTVYLTRRVENKPHSTTLLRQAIDEGSLATTEDGKVRQYGIEGLASETSSRHSLSNDISALNHNQGSSRDAALSHWQGLLNKARKEQ